MKKNLDKPMQDDHAYYRQEIEGRVANPGVKCPYGFGSEMGARCAWLAGHYDKHGLRAWEMARK